MNCCYILYSKSVDHYYVGSCHEDLIQRLKKHNEKGYGTKTYTTIADDWLLFHIIECDCYAQAVRIERHLKRMKSRNYIENLKRYPEMSAKLKSRYAGQSIRLAR